VVSNGFDENEVREVGRYRRNEVRAELGLGPDELAILFIGGPAAHNRRAARFLEEELLPALERPARLIIAGRCARPRRTRRVLALGFVDRLTRLLAAADVAVNPIESGSGSNLKLAEYVAAGVPVVTTPVGLRGYEALAPLVTVAELDEFATAVQTVHRVGGPPPRMADLGWSALGGRLYDVYAELVASRPRAHSSC
jgi:glycosyltransferase involved in cell wall biosynthesis